MAAQLNPAADVNPVANHHLPIFITPPGQTDVLMVVTALFLLLAVVAFGLLFLRLHSLPERMAHRGHKLQFEIVAVLCLIALFTHIHGFWIAALLLALIELPDIGTWMRRIARGVERIAGIKSPDTPADTPAEESQVQTQPADHAAFPLSDEPPGRSVADKELTHA
jgi:hypothetical protein